MNRIQSFRDYERAMARAAMLKRVAAYIAAILLILFLGFTLGGGWR